MSERLQLSDRNERALDKAADVAYGTWYSYTDPKFTGKATAWKGEPATNPLRRAVRLAIETYLAEIEEGA
jgi:hypothetical protein